MEVGLLTRFAPFMELSSRIHPRPAPQLPLWIRHSPRGLLVSHVDCRRKDNWCVPLRSRFLASAANSVGSVSARTQYFLPAPARAEHHPSSARKDDMLHNSARAQGRRLFASKISWSIDNPNRDDQPNLAEALNKHKMAEKMEKNREKMRKALENLKVFAKEKGYCDNEIHAKDLLSRVMSPLAQCPQWAKHGGGLGDDVVRESLEVAHLLLEKAPEEIRDKLYEQVQLKSILEGIIRGDGGRADPQVIQLAKQILTKLPSTPE